MGFRGLGQWLCKPGGDGSAVGGCEGEEERMREKGKKRMEKEMVMVSAVEVQRVQVAGNWVPTPSLFRCSGYMWQLMPHSYMVLSCTGSCCL